MFSYGLLGLIILIGGYLVLAYNGLVKNKNLVEEGWSGIDVQLRRRADLIPNLIETVKGYAAHEDKLFHDIAELRAKSISGRLGCRTIRRGPGDEPGAGPPLRGGGGLSGAEGGRQFPRPAGQALRHRGRDPDVAALLQRRGAGTSTP